MAAVISSESSVSEGYVGIVVLENTPDGKFTCMQQK